VPTKLGPGRRGVLAHRKNKKENFQKKKPTHHTQKKKERSPQKNRKMEKETKRWGKQPTDQQVFFEHCEASLSRKEEKVEKIQKFKGNPSRINKNVKRLLDKKEGRKEKRKKGKKNPRGKKGNFFFKKLLDLHSRPEPFGGVGKVEKKKKPVHA